MSECQIFEIAVRLPSEIHAQSTLVRVLLVRKILACLEISASRAIGSETVDTNILRSDANLSLWNLASWRVGFDIIIESIARPMITVDTGAWRASRSGTMSLSAAGQRVAGVP